MGMPSWLRLGRRRRRRRRPTRSPSKKAATLLLLCLLSTAALALEPGEHLAPWTLLDQFDVPYTLN